MDYKYIEQLLSRYFDAETTLREEQILKAFFAQADEDMPAALRSYKSLFAALEPADGLSSAFDERILRLTSTEGADDRVGMSAPTDEEEPRVCKARVISLSERMQPLLRAAAAVAIFLTMSTAINQSFKTDNVWTDEDQIAEYQQAIRNATLAANADSTLLLTEGISVKTDSVAVADSLYNPSTGFFE